MAEKDVQAPHPETGESDIDFKAVLAVSLGVFAMLVVCGWLAWYLVGSVAQEMPPAATNPPAVLESAGMPHLQLDPAGDLAALRALEDRRLHSAEWIDPRAGIARMPIEAAMALLARRAAANRAPQVAATPRSDKARGSP